MIEQAHKAAISDQAAGSSQHGVFGHDQWPRTVAARIAAK